MRIGSWDLEFSSCINGLSFRMLAAVYPLFEEVTEMVSCNETGINFTIPLCVPSGAHILWLYRLDIRVTPARGREGLFFPTASIFVRQKLQEAEEEYKEEER